jgi:hypothetical protein
MIVRKIRIYHFIHLFVTSAFLTILCVTIPEKIAVRRNLRSVRGTRTMPILFAEITRSRLIESAQKRIVEQTRLTHKL